MICAYQSFGAKLPDLGSFGCLAQHAHHLRRGFAGQVSAQHAVWAALLGRLFQSERLRPAAKRWTRHSNPTSMTIVFRNQNAASENVFFSVFPVNSYNLMVALLWNFCVHFWLGSTELLKWDPLVSTSMGARDLAGNYLRRKKRKLVVIYKRDGVRQCALAIYSRTDNDRKRPAAVVNPYSFFVSSENSRTPSLSTKWRNISNSSWLSLSWTNVQKKRVSQKGWKFFRARCESDKEKTTLIRLSPQL